MRLTRAALERLKKLAAALRPTPRPVTVFDVLGCQSEAELPRMTEQQRADLLAEMEAILADTDRPMAAEAGVPTYLVADIEKWRKRTKNADGFVDPLEVLIEEAGRPLPPLDSN